MATELSNHFKYQAYRKQIDLGADTIKIILMDTGFVFNKDTHATYASLSGGDELATGYGYTQNDKTLSNPSVTEDDTNDRAHCTWDNVSWTANGGSIGPSPGAILVDDTTSDDTIIGYIDFGTERTATDGGTFAINSIVVDHT